MNVPSVLFVSACELNPTALIEKVLNGSLPVGNRVDENITAYSWQIDNKYYSTTIKLCAVASKSISSEAFASSVDGIVIVFDGNDPNALEKAEAWLPFLDCYNAEIKILVCNACCDDDAVGVNKRTAQEWCIQRAFELVELEPTDEVDPDDDFPETTGVERIRQALNAHQWANLVLKTEPSRTQNLLERPEPALVESLEELLEGDSFGDLFSQLAEMKERVGRMSGSARQDAAEQVVRAFWSALGGDDDDL